MIIIDKVYTSRTMLTLPYAIVDILVAVFPHPTNPTFTVVVTNEIRARNGIDARVVKTFISIYKNKKAITT